MPLEQFDLSKEDTRLVKCNETVYKVKVVPQRSFESDLPCSSEVAHKQVEDVLRALLYMDQRSVIFKPIHTEHFVVTTLKKGWKTCQNLIFHLNGNEIKACPYQYILKVDLNDRTSTIIENQEVSNSSKNSQKEQDKIADASPSHDKSGGKSKNRKSGEADIDSKQIVETYKNTQSLTDVRVVGDETDERNDESLDKEFDEEARKNALIERIRKREKLKREQIRKKEEVEKLFTDQTNTKSPGKRKRLYKAELYCNTPGSLVGRNFYQTRSTSKSNKRDKTAIRARKSRGTKTVPDQVPEQDVEGTSRSFTDDLPLVKESESSEIKLSPVQDKQNTNHNSAGRKAVHVITKKSEIKQTPGTRFRLRNTETSKPLESRSPKEIQTNLSRRNTRSASSNTSFITKSARKSQQHILYQKRKSLSKDKVTINSKRLINRTSPCKEEDVNSTGRQGLRKGKRNVSESQNNCSSSSESVGSSDNAKRKERYPLRSRSLSPQGKEKYRDARSYSQNRLQSSGNRNNNSNLSPKIELFRPLRPLRSAGNESDRLEILKSLTLHDKNKRVSRQQIDRHKVEIEEIEESMKLQNMSKSITPPTSPNKATRKRRKSAFWDFVDAFITPVKRVFKS